MAGRMLDRLVKRQISEQGGFPQLCARYASGETVVAMSKTFLWPDGHAIDRSTLSNMIHRWCRLAPENQAAWDAAERDHADSRGERAVHVLEDAPLDRDSIQKAKALSDANFRYAGLRGRERWGEIKQPLAVAVSVANWHVEALQHRIIEASRPLAGVLHTAEGSAADSEPNAERAPETPSPDSIAAA